MKIQRFFAPDMRRAIQQVHAGQGPDAVILSSRSVDGGVEIIAAADYDQDLLAGMAPEAMVPAPAGVSGPALVDRPPAVEADAPGTRRADPMLRAMHRELGGLKAMLREQFARLAWADLSIADPGRALLYRQMAALGLDSALVTGLLEEVRHADEPGRAWRELLFALARRVEVIKTDPLEQGGIFALVGPTGVGKTTTIAKLAARHCLRFGRESLGLITTDTVRVGAQRHLDAFGAILGVPVRRADGAAALADLLQQMRQRRLVLIDTAGMAPRDDRLPMSIGQLDVPGEIRRFLVLPANMQGSTMQEAASAFGRDRLAGVVLTKLDECDGLGAALSMLIRERLPVAWISEGQRVPEDLKLARVAHLLRWAATPPAVDGDSPAVSVPAMALAAAHGEVANAAH